MNTAPHFPGGTILGYPRIGRRRELKKAVEAFWAGTLTAAELEVEAARLRSITRDRLVELGLGKADSSIPEAFSYYDHVLDAAVMLDAIPTRFHRLIGKDGSVDLAGYFTIARGEGDTAPVEMTKWFDSNYHYLVPEIDETTKFALTSYRLVHEFSEAAAQGYLTRPVLVGPVTFLLLSKPSEAAGDGFLPLDRLADLLPVYRALLARLDDAGAQWMQLDEPALVSDTLGVPREDVLRATEEAYDYLGRTLHRPSLFVAAPYGSLRDDAAAVLGRTPIEAIGLDLVRGSAPSPAPGLETKTIVAGVIDGHNIWRGDLAEAWRRVTALRALSPSVTVSTSTSLFHTPHTVDDETRLPEQLTPWLAFADEKVGQIVTLAHGVWQGDAAVAAALAESAAAHAERATAPGVRDGLVRERLAALVPTDFQRGEYADRRAAQDEALNLPPLPTTTIGSFPQTAQIRQARARFAAGSLSEDEYVAVMRDHIRTVVELQEELGLDVIVHGEPERNDMVQYFAEHLEGFASTENGWVQSYGTRCTRPPVLWGDISRPDPITVPWTRYAQSLTEAPVKGMLTGPVTILAWSFVRDDQPLRDTANQVALALRDEVADLEAAGTRIIQVDEPALRELLPLDAERQADYLDWSVSAFRLATSGVRDETQVHTHLCYSEFGAVIAAIDQLDADVTSIEAARSKMDIVDDIHRSHFARGIGPGVYDIHSPRVPAAGEVEALITRALEGIPERQLWINPDCGLKTRGYRETVASLHNMVEAARRVRQATPGQTG
jgi:5-methyltetrahydropteroyltriglutamate--homocysteine methyltransferase